jgi:translation initiation factor IF-2
LRLQKEKVRIFALARELDMESKDLLNLCRQNGIDVKNQLSTIEPEVRDQVVQLVQKHKSAGGPASPTPHRAPTLPTPEKRIPVLDAKPKPAPELGRSPQKAPAVPETPVPPPEKTVPPATATPPVAPSAKTPETAPPPATPRPTTPPERSATPPAASKTSDHPKPTTPPRPPEQGPATETPARPTETPPTPRTAAPTVPTLTESRVRDLGGNRSGTPPRRPGDRGRQIPRPSHPGIATPPPTLQKKLTAPPPKAPVPQGPKKLADIPVELQNRGGDAPLKIEDIHRALQQQQTPGKPVTFVPEDVDIEDDDDGKAKKGPHRRGIGGVAGREDRHKARDARQAARKKGADVPDPKRVGVGLLVEDDVPTHRKDRRPGLRKKRQAPTEPRKGKVPIQLPITVRSLSEAVGVRSQELILKLMNQGILTTINTTLDPVIAEAMALELGCELDVKKQADAEELLLAETKKPDNPEDLVPRAPIVTIMGHVDHGKTSLLDRIRQSNVVATEAGGITQVIRAWRVEHGGRPITFLDTPGHEAFTKMRARGAHVTDIAVIVVAADDGVMPQTEEAINHAKAAGVSIVVAINKVDLPNANLRKTEQQLYGLGLIPDNMGGDVPFVQTSAATGKGIDELLDNLSVVAELKELKANPNKPATGTCLEANLNEGEGVFATILVQDGTLRKGDVVVCGASSGRVRAMYDDQGRHIDRAGPSVPVRITGLDEVPNADDPFAVVPDLSIAAEIAEKRRERLREANAIRRDPVRLESLSDAKIAELKVILKADFRGSIEAIRKELEKLRHDEVRVRILHAAIGGITESDVQLALTSPQDTIIVGFNVVPDDRARALAEERGIQMRQYNIIYKLTDDIRSALEGKLKPREDVIHLGRAVVRETFKISRVGTIAGCYVTQGVIERSAKVRVIRSGVVVYPPPDRTVGLESLKRFKEDTREVREGFECGIKVAGYDDIKVDDVIEAYRIEQVQRTLS